MFDNVFDNVFFCSFLPRFLLFLCSFYCNASSNTRSIFAHPSLFVFVYVFRFFHTKIAATQPFRRLNPAGVGLFIMK